MPILIKYWIPLRKSFSEIVPSDHQPALFFTQSGMAAEVYALLVVDGIVIIPSSIKY